MSLRIHPTALIESQVEIGDGTSVWDHVHIRSSSSLGEQCIVGEKTYIASGVRVGHRVKINPLVYIARAVTIEDGVLVGAGTIFTSEISPRATTPDLKLLRSPNDEEPPLPTLVREGATIGASCTIGSNLVIGRFAMIGMGSLVTKSVPDFHLALGHPATSAGCVCRCGQVLIYFRDARGPRMDLTCWICGLRYHLAHETVVEFDAPQRRSLAA
jgi:UDP-2-acetamido-3-amino-2,3-dideoxy-glucuronate N-acetyltransferase